jgi:hypothetical protein
LHLVHTAAVVCGAGFQEQIARLADEFDLARLSVSHGSDGCWVWLSGDEEPSPRLWRRMLSLGLADATAVGWGEPAAGADGFRSSHFQAQAALAVGSRQGTGSARYRDVAILATLLRDRATARAFVDVWLGPLRPDTKRGRVLCRTLRAYFASASNAAAAAAALEVNERTVAYRLRQVEERLDRPVADVHSQLDTALQLCELLAAPVRRVPAAHENFRYPQRSAVAFAASA